MVFLETSKPNTDTDPNTGKKVVALFSGIVVNSGIQVEAESSLDANCPFREAFYQLHGWHSN